MAPVVTRHPSRELQVRQGKVEYDRAMGELHRRKEQLLAEVERQEAELHRLQASLERQASNSAGCFASRVHGVELTCGAPSRSQAKAKAAGSKAKSGLGPQSGSGRVLTPRGSAHAQKGATRTSI